MLFLCVESVFALVPSWRENIFFAGGGAFERARCGRTELGRVAQGGGCSTITTTTIVMYLICSVLRMHVYTQRLGAWCSSWQQCPVRCAHSLSLARKGGVLCSSLRRFLLLVDCSQTCLDRQFMSWSWTNHEMPVAQPLAPRSPYSRRYPGRWTRA